MLEHELIEAIEADYSAFYLHTSEVKRVENLVKGVAKALNFKIIEINFAHGIIHFGNKYSEPTPIHDEQINKTLLNLFDEDLENTIILIKNAKFVLENNPIAVTRLQALIERIEHYLPGECAIVFQSAEVYIPTDLAPFITLMEMPLPASKDIKALIKEQLNIHNENIINQLISALSGLNELDIQKLLKRLNNKFKQFNDQTIALVLEQIRKQKEQIITKGGVLEMVKVDCGIEDIGGLEKLKNHLSEQAKILANLEKAKAFGVKAPKGILIAGMPGCGKSLTAKAAATLFKQPLLRLDIGSLLGKYVGESETNMRKALAMAESISPCVLWIDELEKAFVGMSGNNASEVSSRLLGYFLTWLQEKTAPVFIVATANDITALPPELLRKGRFDEVFYVGFPNNTERKKILEIHLQKAKQPLEQLNLPELSNYCRDYSGADIENAIYEGVKTAFLTDSKSVSQKQLTDAITNTVPLRKTMKDKVGEYEKKFDELCLAPASDNDGLNIAEMVKMAKDPNHLKRIEVAKNPDVTDDILEQLANDKELEVRKAVFANLNCPRKVLDKVVSDSLEDDNYNKEIMQLIAIHPNVSCDLVYKIYRESYKFNDFDKQLLENKNINHDLIIEMAKDKDISSTIKEDIFNQYENDPVLFDKFEEIFIKGSYAERKRLAESEKISEHTQIQLSKDDDKDILKIIAENPKLSPSAQKELLKSVRNRDLLTYYGSEYCKFTTTFLDRIAQNPNISEETQDFLLDKFRYENYLMEKLASNLNIIERVQLELCRRDESDIFKKLASNSNITEKVQLKIMEMASWNNEIIEEKLVSNPNITEKVQLKMIERYRDKKNRNWIGEAQKIKSNLATNPNVTEKVKSMLLYKTN